MKRNPISHRPLSTLALIAFALLLSADSASAKDFVFEVPYDIKNIQPDVSKFQIDCTIRNKDTLPSNSEFSITGPVVANAYKSLPVNGKDRLSGVARMTFNTESGANPADGKIFYCGLRAFVPGGSYPLWKNDGSNQNVKGHHVDGRQSSRIAINGKIADYTDGARKGNSKSGLPSQGLRR